MYKVIGADGKEYGPVSTDQIRQWIAEHRLIAQSKIQAEGSTEWRTLGELPKFADALAAQAPPTQQPQPPPFAGATLAPEIFARDYYLDIGACISNGFDLFKNNFGLLICAFLIYWAIQIGINLLSGMPFIGLVFLMGSVVFVDGPLQAGLFYVFIKAIRQLPTSASEVFAGFEFRYWQLMLGYIVPAVLFALCFIPAAAVALFAFLPLEVRGEQPSIAHYAIVCGVAFVCIIFAIYVATNWFFTLPLIIDRQLDFLSAMKTSWKMVTKHWWRVFALLLLAGLIGIVGILFCCIGLLVTAPIAIGTLMYAYETIFNPTQTKAAPA